MIAITNKDPDRFLVLHVRLYKHTDGQLFGSPEASYKFAFFSQALGNTVFYIIYKYIYKYIYKRTDRYIYVYVCTRENTLHNGVKILNKFQLELEKSGAINNTGEIARRYNVGLKLEKKKNKNVLWGI